LSEIRKLQQQGKSLTVSLPGTWSKSQNLSKGSYVSISQTKGKGTALVIKKLEEQEEESN
jgi:phosphate uptake regulator